MKTLANIQISSNTQVVLVAVAFFAVVMLINYISWNG